MPDDPPARRVSPWPARRGRDEADEDLVDRDRRQEKVEMVVYKGFGHGVTKPKASRAVMQHNLAWFNHYIVGDPLPDFSAPELPKKEKPEVR